MNDLTRKNTSAFEQAIRLLQEQSHAQTAKIDLLNTALSSMSERMTALEGMLMRQKAASIGTGATVK